MVERSVGSYRALLLEAMSILMGRGLQLLRNTEALFGKSRCNSYGDRHSGLASAVFKTLGPGMLAYEPYKGVKNTVPI